MSEVFYGTPIEVCEDDPSSLKKRKLKPYELPVSSLLYKYSSFIFLFYKN
jgi:hypothetical protein